MSVDQSCIFQNCFYGINLPGGNRGYFLTLLSLRDLDNFIEYFNNNVKSIDKNQQKITQNLRVNMNQCFPNNDLSDFNFITNEIKTEFYQKVYAFLLDEDLNLVSSLSVHFFKQEENAKWYTKIHDVCAAPNRTGTKILMLEVLDKLKPVSEVIWLNVSAKNPKAYHLYLDIGFEFVFNKINKDLVQDMIYYQKDPISSRYDDVLQKRREIIIFNMWDIKMFENYISKIDKTRYRAAIDAEPIELKDNREVIIKDFMRKVNEFLNPVVLEQKYDEMKIEGFERHEAREKSLQPILRIGNLFIFINSLVNNTDNFNTEIYEKYREKLLKILLDFSNIKYEDLSILLRTQFPIEMEVQIKDKIDDKDIYYPETLKINLFSVVEDADMKTYDIDEHFSIPANPKDVYNININSEVEIDILDKHVILALEKGIRKICVRINKNIPINLETLYFKHNLLPSYSASPYKPYTFVYNVRRFNNINNTYWELDSFNLNNLYILPNAPPSQQPITKEIMQRISGCGLSMKLEEYYRDYLNYLNFNTQSYYKYYQDGYAVIFSFFGFILNECNPELINTIFKRIGLYKVNGTLAAGSTTTNIKLNIPYKTKTTDYKGNTITFQTLGGLPSTEKRIISSYDTKNRIATLDSPLSIAPIEGDIYFIVNPDYNFNRLANITPFTTLNFADYYRNEPGLLHNINILCHTRTVNFMSSVSHGEMININNPLDLEKGQKLLMFTNPDKLFYMNLLNHNLIDLIFSENRIQRLFDCIELLNNDNIELQDYKDDYRDIIEILINNVSIKNNDVIIYTEKYYEHNLEYNTENVKWVLLPTTIGNNPRYRGRFNRIFGYNNKIILTDLVNTDLINSNFSLTGLFINFNSDVNTGTNKVIDFEFSKRTVTCSEPIPVDASNVIIGNLLYYIIEEPSQFYRRQVVMSEIPNRDWTIQFLESVDKTLLSFNIPSSKNYEYNDNYLDSIMHDIYTKLVSHPIFLNKSGLSTLSISNSVDKLNTLRRIIVFSKIVRDFPPAQTITIPLSIKTNESELIPNFTKSGSSYVKQYRAINRTTMHLSSLINGRLKYNSFVCCRGITNHVGPLNLQKLPGEISVRELLQKKKLI